MLDPAVNDRGTQRQVFAVGRDTVGDLGGKFAGSGVSTRARTGRRPLPAGAAFEPLEQRQCETGGFPGAGLGCGEQVASLQDQGNRLGLDRGGVIVALFGYGTQQFGLKAEGVKRHKLFVTP